MSSSLKVNNISKTVLKNILVIVLSMLIFAVLGGVNALRHRHTIYEAERNIMTSHSYRGSGANEEVQADINLGKTYAKIVESNDVAKLAHRNLSSKLRKKYSVSDLESMVNANSMMQTTIVKIEVKADSAKSATAIVNAVSEAAAKTIPRKVPSAGKVSLFAKANYKDATSVTTPSLKKRTLLGAAIGLLIGLIIAFSITTWTKLI